VTPIAKQSSVCNSGAKKIFQSMTGGHSPSGYAPVSGDRKSVSDLKIKSVFSAQC